MDDHEYAEMLRQTMVDLTQQFSQPTEIDVTLSRVTAAAIELIHGVDVADVLMIAGPDLFRSVAATDQLAVDLDAAQQQFGEGPCLDAAVGGAPVLCNDLHRDSRWPRFAKSAIAAGITSILSFQLYTHNARMGAMNLFGREPGAFTPEAEAVAVMLATHAAIALIADDMQLQFRSALASRDVIGQAKGMIMERFKVDAVRAFELLTRLSQNSNVRVADVAAHLVARGSEPTSSQNLLGLA
ncbi:MAG: GAF and ANTAR domain-containing protein [Mycobacterium sp.]|uniref:GAF and ANTAR domain-containing protein n=1 Tax=Mycobacterium sp. TaxID=1785 RepID=UPI003C5AD170